ncbi:MULTISPECIES: siderophore-interacting protein [unclassified Novosphingobium]|uniref:siderophore-interacting protein n=1 Tax=unclassified Novosphingobium TaxID=2644732 RepID=UPI0014419F7E|nr:MULTISPECIES: siderophore-interacting protein [unclassified Novosphingobium]MBB3358992.1 NADPH-dependent ferric siderophore reductase [Novosphingobium sp. BK256]MBB3375527.1 NADPH-dependent ferric siderophore reductase [Novosphingobium sp. BK280]MBB3379764.1 NADPH-dependent ferric siderophore reductase [Novosphingobium sp. BK258]MBB3421459.1 NADPH-dependent ferric siderophore reductase [Novosphingobium sp. BK267]MBB3449774.1 NADPH-dependent ferric siderophore reductase [Novosphingobium sp. 
MTSQASQTSTPPSDPADVPVLRRMRHETTLRTLRIARHERLTPNMIRIVAEGPELAGFVSGAPDDHIKVFVEGGPDERIMRDYTPRHHDAAAGTLTIDFFDHEGGPVSDWARAAQVGDPIRIGGPRGSQVIEGPIAHWLLVGDETALPAIGRRVEELPAGVHATVIGAVPGAADEQTFATAATLETHWLHRDAAAATDPAPIIAALAQIDLPPATFVWIAAEAGVARAAREYLVETRGLDKRWIKAAGYWVAGQADSSAKNLGEADAAGGH